MYSQHRLVNFLLAQVFCIVFLFGCAPASSEFEKPSGGVVYYSEIAFSVKIPEATPETDAIYLDFVDEVTGLAFNITRYEMTKVSKGVYELKIPVPLNSVIKYRYSRRGSLSTSEFTSEQSQVRYRLVYADGQKSIDDVVASWADISCECQTGVVVGKAIDQNGEPVGNQHIAIGGKLVVSRVDGTFRVDGLLAGQHNLVVISPDGAYKPFQQGVVVAENAVTPADFIMLPIEKMTKVQLVVTIPQGTPPEAPVRIVGNHPSLGNTFGELSGGMSVIASRSPILSLLGKSEYTITLYLPAGFDLRYKYTLGDGFWNAELNSSGGFVVRQLIVPSEDVIINDTVQTWGLVDNGSIRFEVQADNNLSPDDTISIQFHAFSWFEPIPMWPTGDNSWAFTLFSPLQFFEEIQYQYCRNDQCGSAQDVNFLSPNLTPREISISNTPQTRTDTLQWAYAPSQTTPTTIVALNVIPRGKSFLAGIELSEQFHPGQVPYFAPSLNRIQDIGANWIIITPSWHYPLKSSSLSYSSQVPGADPSWSDTIELITLSKAKGLKVALFPRLLTFQSPELWWKQQYLSSSWWDSWFADYENYLMHFGKLASEYELPAIIIGGPEILPALPAGFLPGTATDSNAPADAYERWLQIIEKLRQVYTGQIIWAIPSDQVGTAPEFLNNVDQIYVLFSQPLSLVEEASQDDFKSSAAAILDTDIYPLYENFQRPVVLGVYYPSVKEASMGCTNPEDACLLFDYSEPVDVDEQASIYTALLAAGNERSWISGFVSRGYFPAVAVQDKSASINGKPAADILWYWYPRILMDGQ